MHSHLLISIELAGTIDNRGKPGERRDLRLGCSLLLVCLESCCNGTAARRAPGRSRRRPTCVASSPGSSYDLTGPRDPVSTGACSAALTPIPNACPSTPARTAAAQPS